MIKSTKTNSFIEKAKTTHGDRYDYSKSIYVDCLSKVIIICKIHGKFLQSPVYHLRNRGCPQCGKDRVAKLFYSNTNEFIQKAIRTHGMRYDYSFVHYIDSTTKINICCKRHGKFLQSPNSHLRKSGCPLCKNRISTSEIEFLNYCKIPNKVENRQKLIRRFKVDGWDDKSDTVYEFLGDYWHGNPHRFNSFDFNKHCNLTFGELYNSTFHKFEKLKRMGYNIKYIWESDWNKYKKGVEIKPKIISYP